MGYLGAQPGVTSVTVGASGAGTDHVFYKNDQTVNTSFTLEATQNAMSAGPVAVANGVTVTVSAGAVWTIV